MRILWICNIMLPAIAKKLDLPYSNREGWLSGTFEKLCGEKDRSITLGICYPVADKKQEQNMIFGTVKTYSFYEDLNHPEKYDIGAETRFQTIIDNFKPDILHIFGTEFPHSLAAAKTFNCPEKTLVGIQGLCSEIAPVYMAGLPQKTAESVTFRDIVRKDTLRGQQEKFRKRGEHEKELLKLTGNITGRTSFDRENSLKYNDKARYYSMNETMRTPFYTGRWEWNGSMSHRIFMGQGDYPLKGFHIMLGALHLLKEEYADCRLVIAGNSLIQNRTWKDKLKRSAYGKYLLELIMSYGVKDNIEVLGKLDELEMKKQFMECSVFVCPSVLENSPNTVAEAMLLGVPVVASKTGGIPDMAENEKEILLAAPLSTEELANQIRRVFKSEDQDTDEYKNLSTGARKKAWKNHNPNENYQRLLEIYREISK